MTVKALQRSARLPALLVAITAVLACNNGSSRGTGTGRAQGKYGEYYYVSLGAKPANGTVQSSDLRINCGVGGDQCGDALLQTRYEWSQSVTLNASPADGYKFEGWFGDCTGTGTCSVSAGADRTVVAAFTPLAVYKGVYFTISIAPPTGGSVDSTSPYIHCAAGAAPSACGPIPIPWGDTVTLTAHADPGYTFQGWGGDCASGSVTCVLSTAAKQSDKNVSAIFLLPSNGSPLLSWDNGTWDGVVWQ